jgi:hypothetical protein
MILELWEIFMLAFNHLRAIRAGEADPDPAPLATAIENARYYPVIEHGTLVTPVNYIATYCGFESSDEDKKLLARGMGLLKESRDFPDMLKRLGLMELLRQSPEAMSYYLRAEAEAEAMEAAESEALAEAA